MRSKSSQQTLNDLAGQSVHSVCHTVNAAGRGVRHCIVAGLNSRSNSLSGALYTTVDCVHNGSSCVVEESIEVVKRDTIKRCLKS